MRGIAVSGYLRTFFHSGCISREYGGWGWVCGGRPDHRVDGAAPHLDASLDPGADEVDGPVTGMVVLASVLSVGLFVYLVCALLKPEWFV